MKNRYITPLIIAMTSVALSVFGAVLVRAFWYAPDNEVPYMMAAALVGNESESAFPEAEGADVSNVSDVSSRPDPARLEIPTLGIDAKVQKVGINKKGNMAAPNNFTDVGWYRFGARPGAMGSAVMAGHTDNGLAMPGVFRRLGDLEEGDDIYVETSEGERLHYAVTGFSVYPYDSIVEEIFTQDDNRYLKLITCTGEWMQSKKTHNKRLVVTAVQI